MITFLNASIIVDLPVLFLPIINVVRDAMLIESLLEFLFVSKNVWSLPLYFRKFLIFTFFKYIEIPHTSLFSYSYFSINTKTHMPILYHIIEDIC